ncbi:DUF6463 family protein [Pelomonas sp. BJYL3]|uniref:DUF6463 family protein n=1 Tax=Pelomonas sp. BJYL3 TaxID=2976697 RepID=UPI0022B457D1|nr:DUF6463 family protein [Pelomonas sp. BJYL3]
MPPATLTPVIDTPLPLRPSRWQAWEGPWLLAVAAVHTLFGLLVFAPVLRAMLAQGWIDTVGTDPLRGAVSWFLLFGLPLALLALCIRPLRQAGQARRLRLLGWGLLGLCAAGASLMPASGFWLVLPPALSLLWPRRPGR